MSANDFQVEVAQIALTAATPHGYALAGGRALIAYGIVNRATEDIDLFTNVDDAARDASDPVRAALIAAGLEAELIPETTEMGEVFYGFNSDMVEFEVRRGDQTVRLTLARFDRTADPVTLDIGTTLHLDDVLGSKVAATATRAEPRDFIDVAAAMRRFPIAELLWLAHRSEASLADDDFAESMSRLDRLDDSVFAALYGLSGEEIGAMREAFAGWPRQVAAAG